MDTGILHLTGRSCHDNKSQRADPFVVLSRIIAGKTKCVKDRFSSQILPETHKDAGLWLFLGFLGKFGQWRGCKFGRGKEKKKKKEKKTKGGNRVSWVGVLVAR
ncbi:hypothetical protein J9B06_26460, partial [Klebsiella pneumoniae]